jgi:hypothetical protein
MLKRILAPVLTAGFIAASLAAVAYAQTAGNSILFTSKGDVVFPFTPPTRSGTAGTIDNMVIGSGTPRAGTFTTVAAASGFAGPVAATTLSASSTVSGAGFTARFSTPGPIGDGTASTGAFSTLSASGAVSGAGFTARFSTPGPIGDTVASTGAFSTLSASGAVSGAGVTALFASPPAIGGTAPAAVTATTLRSTGIVTVTQGTPTAATVSATLTAANLLTGIITVNQGGAGASAQQLPAGGDLDTALPAAVAGDAFDFSVINISTTAAESASLTTNTGLTLVGDMDIAANSAVTTKSAGRFRARKTGTALWTVYRLS